MRLWALIHEAQLQYHRYGQVQAYLEEYLVSRRVPMDVIQGYPPIN